MGEHHSNTRLQHNTLDTCYVVFLLHTSIGDLSDHFLHKHEMVYVSHVGVSNRWTGMWNGMMEWKMEWNSEHAQLQLTRVTGTVQSRLNYLVYICYLTAEAL